VVANGGVSYTLPAQTQQQIGGRREGVLSRLRRDDRAGCDRGDCSRQSAGAGRPGICHAPLHARWRLSAHGPALPAAVGHRELEFGRNVTVGWHVAVDFEADADFN
jgi:hypothetical protein